MKSVSDGRGGRRDPEEIPPILSGTMVTSDLARARRFYEDFLGLECVQPEPGKLLLRDKRAADLMRRGERGGIVIEVKEVVEIRHPQQRGHHWGFDAESTEEVDRMRSVALANDKIYGLKKIMPTTRSHGSYQFYFSDSDDNWWEIQYLGRSNENVFEDGDFKPAEESAMAQEVS